MPREANPNIDVPIFYVSATQNGLSPEDGARLIARPLESKLRGLDGMKEITAISSEGHVSTTVEFDVNVDADEALADLRLKIDEAQPEFLQEADEPIIAETNYSLVPTLCVTLSGQVPERTLHLHARTLQDEIEALPTVLEARLSGEREERRSRGSTTSSAPPEVSAATVCRASMTRRPTKSDVSSSNCRTTAAVRTTPKSP